MTNLLANFKRSFSKPPMRFVSRFGIIVIGLLITSAELALGDEAVLLRTGRVLQGVITYDNSAATAANQNLIIKRENSEVRIRANEILARANTLSGLYHWQRSHLNAPQTLASDHLRLADWCMRNQLWAEASRELLDAKQLAPRSERLALLVRRLHLLSSSEAETIAQSQRPTQATRTQPTPAASYPVQVASFEQPIEQPANRTKLHLGNEEHKYFSRKLQPLLVNNCTESGCHRQGGTESFVLDVSLLHGYGDQRSTQSNLREVLSAINQSDPTTSPLLVAARGPHAGVSPFAGPRREEWLARLESWILQVSGTAPSIEATSLEGSASIVSAEAINEPTSENQPKQIVGHKVAAQTDSMQSPEEDSLEPARPAILGGQLKQIAPRDEFDPEIFNRKYRRPEDDLPSSAP